MNLEKILKKYDYNLPKNLIASAPSRKRDEAKLLVYSRKDKKAIFDRYKNIAKYLPAKSILVFNNTKVIPARLTLKKITGGKVRVLFISFSSPIKALCDKKMNIGAELIFHGRECFEVAGKDGGVYLLKPFLPVRKLREILEKYGEMPLPSYIKNTPLTKNQIRRRYQTVFAKFKGSVAAPTASLHFTKQLLKKIKKAGHDVAFVTLHVNLGTFAPIKKESIEKGELHKEYFEIKKETTRFLAKAKREGRPIIAIGTTVVRALESTARILAAEMRGETDLFIREGYKFKFVDGVVTNFHVPKSSLFMLVCALTGRKELLDVYKKAIKNKFRFFSFGDGMLIV